MADYPPKKNTAFTFYVSLISQANTKIAQVNPTLAAGDVKVAIDDGAPANLATLPVVDADFTKRVKVAMSASEMNGDNITIIFSDAAGAEWCDLTVNIQTVTRQLTDLAYPATSGRSMVVDAAGLVDANVVKLGPSGSGTAQTARDVGASVIVGTNNDKTGYTLSSAGIQAIWDALTSALTTAGSIGKLLVDNINATISSRSSHSAADVWAVGTRTLTSFGTLIADIWAALTSGLTTAGSIGKLLVDNINATVSSRSSHSAADVWSVATRLLTAGTNIVLAKGTGVTGFNDLSAAQVNAEVVDALNVDTYAEPGQGTPAATLSLAAKINYLFKSWRNKKTQTSTQFSLFADDATTVDQKATVSDDGTTTTIGEIATGP